MKSRLIRAIATVMGVCLLLLTGQTAWALDGKTVVSDEAGGCLFVNLGKIYSLIIDKVKALDEPANAEIKKQLSQVVEIAGRNFTAARSRARAKACATNMKVMRTAADMYNMTRSDSMKSLDLVELHKGQYLKAIPECPDKGTYSSTGNLAQGKEICCSIHGTIRKPIVPDGKNMTPIPSIDEMVKEVLDFDARGIFRPTGGVWLSVTTAGEPRLVIEATCKPKVLIEMIHAAPLQMDPSVQVTENLVSFRTPTTPFTQKGAFFELRPGGLVVNPAPAGSTSGFSDFLQNVAKPEMIFALDIDGEKVKKHTDVPASDFGKPAFLADPRLETFTRLQAMVSEKDVSIRAAVGDANTRADLKALIDMALLQAKNHVEATPSQNPTQATGIELLKKILARTTVYDKDGWIGLYAEIESPEAMMTIGIGVAGVLAAVAVPNFQAARENARDNARQKACYATMRVIQGGIEMYNMAHAKPMTTIDMSLLVSEQYLRSPLSCPEDGSYSMEGEPSNFRIKCSKHGYGPGYPDRHD